MSAGTVNLNVPLNSRIPECRPRERFDPKITISELVNPFPKATVMSKECSRGVQTVTYPPVPLGPIIRQPVNPFRKQVLWKYPFLVDKDSLYDKKKKIFRHPDEMLSTYQRDFGCILGEIELIRSTGRCPPAEDSAPKILPFKDYRPRIRTNFSSEMEVFYTLPGGKWALHGRNKPRVPEPKRVYQPKMSNWKSEYQANINGMALYMKEKKVLTRKAVVVERIPTLVQ